MVCREEESAKFLEGCAATPTAHAATSAGWLAQPQPILKTPGLVGLLILANAIVPFSLDIYTPSVPEMPAYFDTTVDLVNLTILGFFLFFAVGLLLFGPVSDKLGRKPVLSGGFLAYIAGSVACALAPTIYVLIAARIVQALGAGAVNAVTTAMVKDCFVSERRNSLLAIIQVLAVVGPVFAPLLGGFIISFAPWRAIFWVLAALGALCLAATIAFRESLPPDQRVKTGVFRSLAGLGHIAHNRKFMLITVAVSLFNLPFMAYIAVGSYIYVDFFGETQQVYTYFFAATAGFSALGPILHLRFGKGLSPYAFTYVLIVTGLAAGVAMLCFGDANVWLFVALMTVFATLESTVRPYTTSMLLGLARNEAGAASSMLNSVNTLLGVAGMALIMLPFPDYVMGIGVLLAASMAASLAAWFFVCRC